MTNVMKKIVTPYDEWTYKVIGLAMTVHNEIGPGFSEEIYQRAMEVGMMSDKVPYNREFSIQVLFRGERVGKFELDFVVAKLVVVELKAVATLAPVYEQQLIAYLAASGLPVGLLINFGASRLEYRRLFPPKAVQASAAFKARQSLSA